MRYVIGSEQVDKYIIYDSELHDKWIEENQAKEVNPRSMELLCKAGVVIFVHKKEIGKFMREHKGIANGQQCYNMDYFMEALTGGYYIEAQKNRTYTIGTRFCDEGEKYISFNIYTRDYVKKGDNPKHFMIYSSGVGARNTADICQSGEYILDNGGELFVSGTKEVIYMTPTTEQPRKIIDSFLAKRIKAKQ